MEQQREQPREQPRLEPVTRVSTAIANGEPAVVVIVRYSEEIQRDQIQSFGDVRVIDLDVDAIPDLTEDENDYTNVVKWAAGHLEKVADLGPESAAFKHVEKELVAILDDLVACTRYTYANPLSPAGDPVSVLDRQSGEIVAPDLDPDAAFRRWQELEAARDVGAELRAALIAIETPTPALD
jgi:hypothetical protein